MILIHFFLISALFGTAAFAILSVRSGSFCRNRVFANNIVNFTIILAVFFVMIVADFYYSYYVSRTVLGPHLISLNKNDMIYSAAVVFSFVQVSLAVIIVRAHLSTPTARRTSKTGLAVWPRLRPSNPVTRASCRAILLLAMLLIFAFIAAYLSENGLSLLSIRRMKSVAYDQFILYIGAWTVFPAFSLWLFVTQPRLRWALAIATMIAALLMVTGSRTRIITPYIAILFYLPYRKIWLKAWIIPPMIISGLLLSNLFLETFRMIDADRLARFQKLSGEGFLESTFRSNEFAVAETLTMAVTEGDHLLERTPGSSIVGALAFALPRSIWSGKPINASAQFTQVYDPEGWALYRRALVISGFADLVFEFGPAGAVLVWGALLSLFLHYSARVLNSEDPLTVYWAPCLFTVMFFFLRNDIQLAAAAVWSFGLIRLLLAMIAPFAGAARGGRRAPAPPLTRR